MEGTVAVDTPTPEELIDHWLEFAQLKESDLLFDLGCGDARFLVKASSKCSCNCVGIELDEKQIQLAEERIAKEKLESKVKIEKNNFLNGNCSFSLDSGS